MNNFKKTREDRLFYEKILSTAGITTGLLIGLIMFIIVSSALRRTNFAFDAINSPFFEAYRGMTPWTAYWKFMVGVILSDIYLLLLLAAVFAGSFQILTSRRPWQLKRIACVWIIQTVQLMTIYSYFFILMFSVSK